MKEEDLKYEIEREKDFEKKHARIKIIAIAALLITIPLAGYFVYSEFQNTVKDNLQPVYETGKNLPEALVQGKNDPEPQIDNNIQAFYTSEIDKNIQGEVKDSTGYDLADIARNQEGTENERIASLLILVKEVDTIESQFYYVQRSFGLNEQEWNELRISELDANDISNANVLKMIDNLIRIEDFYGTRGLVSYRLHSDKLRFLKDYFSNYELPKGEIDQEVQDSLVGINVDYKTGTYEELVSKMIEKHNSAPEF